MLDENNVLTKSFRVARERFVESGSENFMLRLIGGRKQDGGTYNLPTVAKVVGLIVNDVDAEENFRDIFIEIQSRMLQRINELHPSYLVL